MHLFSMMFEVEVQKFEPEFINALRNNLRLRNFYVSPLKGFMFFAFFQATACDVEGMRDKMFRGEKINFTEVRFSSFCVIFNCISIILIDATEFFWGYNDQQRAIKECMAYGFMHTLKKDLNCKIYLTSTEI